MNDSFVYFVEGKNFNGDTIRIGHSDDIIKRLAGHKKYGLRLLAIIPSEQRNEDALHNYFKPHLTGQDTSTYWRAAVFPYVERLLHWGFAAPNLEEARQWSQPDFQSWRPDKIEQPLWDGNQGTLFVTEKMRVDARDTYETPDEIANICRLALGGEIDTDPCSNPIANRRIGAKSFYTKEQNGLNKSWFGRVLLNPPYGGKKEKGAALFTQKLVNEINLGNTSEAITILNLQSMPTLWFPIVWKNASAHGVWNKRIDFIRPRTATGHKPFSSSKNGTIFSYFGPHPCRFAKEFAHWAMVWIRG